MFHLYWKPRIWNQRLIYRVVFQAFVSSVIQSFKSFTLNLCKAVHKSFTRSLFVAKIHPCYGALLTFIYFAYYRTCQRENDTWFIHLVCHRGVFKLFPGVMLWYSQARLWWYHVLRVSLGCIPPRSILGYRTYICSTLEGNRQQQLSP